MRLYSATATALLLCLVFPVLGHGQNSAPAVNSDPRYPDQGFLSDSRYTNSYFGFSFDLPADAQLHPVHRPVAPDGHLQLLELDGPSPARLTVSVTAFFRSGKNSPDSKQMLRRELDNELFYGVEELHGLTKTAIDKHQFFFYETRRGIDLHYFLATDLDGYVIHVALAGRDERTLSRLQQAFAATKFFDPSQAPQMAGADAKPYEGPAMSAHRLAGLTNDPPAGRIESGNVNNDEYHNGGLGLVYDLPKGWSIGTQPAVERAVERVRQMDGDGPWIGKAEADLVKACNRVLFSAWKEPPGANGLLAYDDFGEVTLSAMSMACFPDMLFPESVSDAAGIKAFVSQFALTHPLIRETRQGRAFESVGHLFVMTEGTVAFQVEGDPLSRRLSIAMLITKHRGYLLTWFFAAPHQSELRELMDSKMILAPEVLPAIASKGEISAGGGATASAPSAEEPTASPAQTSAAPSAAPSAAQNSATSGQGQTPQATPASTPASSTTQSSTSSDDSARPPSLLKPGETMDDQQMKGVPLPKKH